MQSESDGFTLRLLYFRADCCVEMTQYQQIQSDRARKSSRLGGWLVLEGLARPEGLIKSARADLTHSGLRGQSRLLHIASAMCRTSDHLVRRQVLHPYKSKT